MELIHETPPYELTEYGIEFFIMHNSADGIAVLKHIHPAIEVIYITKGSFEITVDNHFDIAVPGDMVLFRSNAVHSIKNAVLGEEGSYYVLKLSPTFLFTMFQKNSIDCLLPFLKSGSKDKCFYKSDSLPDTIKNVWQSMLTEYQEKRGTFYAMQRLYACQLILNCSRHLELGLTEGLRGMSGLSEANFCRIYDSVNYINENYELPLTAMECAKLENLSYSHYAKLFRRVVGKSFKEYLIGLRMAKAYNMLLSSSASVLDVAVNCGYENFSHFIAEFKRKYGCTPGNFRRNQADQ